MDEVYSSVVEAPRLYLSGPLAEICGAAPAIRFATIRQALGLLKVNYPDLKRIKDMPIRICLNDFEVGPEAFDLELNNSSVVCIEPAVQGAGAGDGLGKLLLGAVVIASAGTLAAPLAGLSSSLQAVQVESTISAVGINLALGGVSQMLTPATTTPSDEKRGGGSYSGPKVNSGEGVAMPLLYGYSRVGGVVIQTSIDAVNA